MGQDLYFRGALVLPDRVVEGGVLRVTGKVITGLWDPGEGRPPEPPPGSVIQGDYICPGFIDLHVHGGGGADFMDGDPEAVATITSTHARYGTTGLLATTLTAPEEEIRRAIRAVKAAPQKGARVLGFHVEGPFINGKMKGAQAGRYVRRASVGEIDRWFTEGSPDDRWHVTLAPEIFGAIAAIRHLVQKGAVVSAGHTDCTYAQLEQAANAGLSHVTHLYNAMRGLHHREPGTVGAALTLPGLTVEIIADGIHIHPAALAVAVRARGTEQVILVTDAMRATGLGDGIYRLGELDATVRDGEARLADGTLAGSVLTMDAAVRSVVRFTGVALHEAVAMATVHPARRHRLAAKRGSLAVGKLADVVVLDRHLQTRLTLAEGRVVYDGR